MLLLIRLRFLSRKGVLLKLDFGNNLCDVRDLLFCSEFSLRYFAEIC